jgi:hypothetical protein
MAFFSLGFFDRERIEVTLIGSPADKETEGFDWVNARVQVWAGGFTGDVQIYICLSDIVRFRQELEPVYNDLRGVAEFKTLEDQLYVRVESDALGHIAATGYLKGDFARGDELKFDLRFDQTLLFHTLSETADLLYELTPTTAQQIVGREPR